MFLRQGRHDDCVVSICSDACFFCYRLAMHAPAQQERRACARCEEKRRPNTCVADRIEKLAVRKRCRRGRHASAVRPPSASDAEFGTGFHETFQTYFQTSNTKIHKQVRLNQNCYVLNTHMHLLQNKQTMFARLRPRPLRKYVQGLGIAFEVQNTMYMVQNSKCLVSGFRFEARGIGFRVHDGGCPHINTFVVLHLHNI